MFLNTTHKSKSFSKLLNKKILSIQGNEIETRKLLNALVTTNILKKFENDSQTRNPNPNQHNPNQSNPNEGTANGRLNGFDNVCCYSTAFLSAQGRIISDSIIYPQKDGFLVEVQDTQVTPLKAHLQRYILRSKIRVDERPDLDVWHCWGPGSLSVDSRQLAHVSVDPRHDLMGHRMIRAGDFLNIDANFVPNTDYLLHRILLGIPEGGDDFVYNSSLPLQMNLDLTHSVDFKKGCYLGQELTHRTKHTGVVRSRLVPVIASKPTLESSGKENVSFGTGKHPEILDYKPSKEPLFTKEKDVRLALGKGTKVGRTCSSIGNIGLAVIKLNHIQLPQGLVIDSKMAEAEFVGTGEKELVLDDGTRLRAFSSTILDGYFQSK